MRAELSADAREHTSGQPDAAAPGHPRDSIPPAHERGTHVQQEADRRARRRDLLARDDGLGPPPQKRRYSASTTSTTPATGRSAARSTPRRTAAQDQIRFEIPGPGPHVIALASDLPSVTQPVAIRGYTEPSSSQATPNSAANPSVVIDATNAVSGLRLAGDGIEVRGLVIKDAEFDGVWVPGKKNVVAGNYIGTNSAGNAPRPTGVRPAHRRQRQRDRRTEPADRNLIAELRAASASTPGRTTSSRATTRHQRERAPPTRRRRRRPGRVLPERP